MSQNYNYIPQQFPYSNIGASGAGAFRTQPYPSVPLKGRPVTSLEEAKAAPIDFDGSVFYFPDIANKKIYTKQINLDGTASLNVYEFIEIPIESQIPFEQDETYIKREEFEEVVKELKALISNNQKSELKTF